MVAAGPSPGSTPTTVPRKQPTKHHSKFTGCSATEKPCSSPPRTSISEPEETGRKLDAQDHREHEVKRRRHADRCKAGGQRRAMENNADDHKREQREAQHKSKRLHERD